MTALEVSVIAFPFESWWHHDEIIIVSSYSVFLPSESVPESAGVEEISSVS